ncbi:MAG TPA: prepilin-type N-terminal cleavage/methylation domain-containing protein [Patescibacteria group bacterium]|nr:prepilin-type N-terminal cleavage/methylation domain-containing protein [Patescibacteria group bacterium]
MIKKLKINKGFTLVEMTVVVAIFVLVYAASLANFRKGDNRSELLLAAENLAGDIKKIQTQTLSGSVAEEIEPVGGFGVYFNLTNNSQYVLFRDNGDEQFQAQPGDDAVLETVQLPGSITLDELLFNDQPTADLTIVFKPPKPDIYFNDALAASSTIVLASEKLNEQAGKISVYKFTGKVSAELINLPN